MINSKYVYFAFCTKTNLIINGWELLSDIESLKYYAKIDMSDMDYKPSQYKILSKDYILKTLNINPLDSNNWKK